MATVLFVHGTGVREQSFNETFGALRENLAQIRPDVAVRPCYWGDACGSSLLARGVSIPSGNTTRGLVEPSDYSDDGWDRLDDDPLYELRLLGLNNDDLPERGPWMDIPGEGLKVAVRQALVHSTVVSAAASAGISIDLRPAAEAVLESDSFYAAVVLEEKDREALTAIVVRSIVAAAIGQADDRIDGTLALDGRHRDAVVDAMISAVTSHYSDRSILAKLGNVLLASGLTRPVERHRKVITGASAEMPGDVLKYLVRGEKLRQFIADSIRDAAREDDVIVIAHSLGGIAALETLIINAIPQVRQLITVGSQAGLLYELNALPSLEFGARLPNSVPEWTNIFDTRDLLGYAASGLFPGRVEDRIVDNGMPFPRSHSAYFRSQNFFEVLDEVLR
ncbi:hypothetical protein ACWDOP_02990 [Nocardia sp. NPDC003693]